MLINFLFHNNVCGSGQGGGTLSLKVADNNYVCDDKMHWIKCGQEHGWIQLLDTLECTNRPDALWDDIVLSLAGNMSILLSSFMYLIRLITVSNLNAL